MSLINRQKVTSYFELHSTKPLQLDEDALDSISKTLPLDELIYEILELSNEYSTLNRDGSKQCRIGAYRSSGDIWRLVKYLRADVTIFEVMQALYDLVDERQDDDIYCSFCCDIQKRVFSSDDCDLYASYDLDEYGLTFDQWNGI